MIKLRAGRYYVPVELTTENDRLFFHFEYNKDLIDIIKSTFEGRRWHGFIVGDERKLWSIPLTQHNVFQLEVLKGKYGNNPYAHWEQELDRESVKQYYKERGIKPYEHQIDLVAQGLKYRHVIWAAEMGTGKTLCAIVLLEMLGYKDDIFWVAPKSALYAAQLEFRKWRSQVHCSFYTYEGFKKVVETWPDDKPAPRVLILDESSRCKTPTAQRTIAARHCADSIRREHAMDSAIVEMSGSPAPKSPVDWYAQAEIACPGFLYEGTIHAFRESLGLFESVENETGTYKKLITWLDDEKKCTICGELEGHINHSSEVIATIYGGKDSHKFKKSENRVARLQKRLQGLVNVKLKADCLDLPEKQYEIFEVEPTNEILNAAKLIVKTTTRTVDALIKLRTLSDGFLYKETGTGVFVPCPNCEGKGTEVEFVDADDPDNPITMEEAASNKRFIWEEMPPDEDPLQYIPKIIGERPIVVTPIEVVCSGCSGERRVERMERTLTEVPCPKDDVLIQCLDMHEEIGRFNVYAGFQGSVDRVCKIVAQHGWEYIKADGRGWSYSEDDGIQRTGPELLWMFQEQKYLHEKVCFVGQPSAAGLGVTLTASPTTMFYSNDYNPESRFQAEDRGHRLGMDVLRGGWIYDVFHLPSDRKVWDALRRSRNLQYMSLTGMNLKELYDV